MPDGQEMTGDKRPRRGRSLSSAAAHDTARYRAAPGCLRELAEQQGVGPVQCADELAGEPMPDEDLRAFLTAMGRDPDLALPRGDDAAAPPQ